MTTTLVRSTLVIGMAMVVAACAGGDSTAPPKPANVSAANNGVSGTVGAVLTAAPTFTVVDGSGNALANVGVSVVVTTGGGTLVGAPTKTSSGATAVGTWTLGNTAGSNTLTITVSGLATPLTISATGTPDVPTQINATTGAAQSAFAGAALALPVTFKVGDKFNNGVPSVAVTFSIGGGGGTLASASAGTTDASGLVAAPAWTLGKSTVAQQLRAAAAGITTTASATVATNYAVEVRYFGPPVDATIQAAFTASAARIQGFITGDLANVNFTATNTLDLAPCGITGTPPLNEVVDDIFVYANVAPIDGVGNILGSAGPCYVRTVGGLPIVAVMNLDVADLQNLQASNRLNDVILHEMMHTLGFGTLWASKGQVSGAATASSAFIGLQAVSGCVFHGGTAANQCGSGTVPLETTGGNGTRDVHWREATTATGVGFRTEVMTGFVSAAGIANPMTQMSIASLADIGYVVNLLPYDAYTVPSALAASFSAIQGAQGMGEFTINEVMRAPIGSIDAAGRVTSFQGRR